MTLMAFAGLAQSGKSTAAQVASDLTGLPLTGFAWRLKRIVADLWIINPGESDKVRRISDLSPLGFKALNDLAALYDLPADPTLRQVYQGVGMYYRGLCQDYWLVGMSTSAIITDLRFPNEADWVRRNGGIVIKIIRPGVGRMDHPSEGAEFPVDYKIMNDGFRSDFITNVTTLIKEIA